MTDLDRDTIILALTAYAEASSEGQDGIRAQVHSVVNRHAIGRWYSRKTLAGTCLLAFAYSAFNTSDPNRERAAETPTDDPIMHICLKEAALAIQKTTIDPTSGSTHYYAAGTPEPGWVRGVDKDGKQVAEPAIYTTRIGKHLFYRGVT